MAIEKTNLEENVVKIFNQFEALIQELESIMLGHALDIEDIHTKNNNELPTCNNKSPAMEEGGNKIDDKMNTQQLVM